MIAVGGGRERASVAGSFELSLVEPRVAAVTGGRSFVPTPDELSRVMSLLDEYSIDVVRSGTSRSKMDVYYHDGSGGFDEYVYAHVHDVYEREMWPARWDRFGKNAGPMRSRDMLEGNPMDLLVRPRTSGIMACLLIAAPGGEGTRRCKLTARGIGVTIEEITRSIL